MCRVSRLGRRRTASLWDGHSRSALPVGSGGYENLQREALAVAVDGVSIRVAGAEAA
jgi:hypothetical protein